MKKRISFNDPILDKAIHKIELPQLTKTKDVYLDMLEVIISQQLAGNVARVIYNRFLDLFENRYPKPKLLVETDDIKLSSVGLSNAKAKYVKNLAEFALKNDISVKHIESMSDEEIIDFLTQVKGIGKWSVEMILIFSLQRPDVFPYDDLVIKKSVIEIYKINEAGKELIPKMNSIAEIWKPNRSLASRYLWAYYGLKMNNKKKK